MVSRKTGHAAKRGRNDTAGDNASSLLTSASPSLSSLPPITAATLANQLQQLRLGKHVERFMMERMLREVPTFMIGDGGGADLANQTKGSGGDSNGTKDGGKKSGAAAGGGGTDPSSSVAAPPAAALLGPVEEEEDFCAFLDRAREQLRIQEEQEAANAKKESKAAAAATAEAASDADAAVPVVTAADTNADITTVGEAQQQEEEQHHKARHASELSDAEWAAFVQAHEALWGRNGTQFNMFGPAAPPSTPSSSSHHHHRHGSNSTAIVVNRLLSHYKSNWVPFAEHHRHDGLVTSPIPFLRDLSSRMGAWCDAMRAAMVGESLSTAGASPSPSAECSSSLSALPSSSSSSAVVAFPTFPLLHEPLVMAAMGRFDAAEQAEQQCPLSHGGGEGNATNAHHHDDADDAHADGRQQQHLHLRRRATFATLSCSDLSVVDPFAAKRRGYFKESSAAINSASTSADGGGGGPSASSSSILPPSAFSSASSLSTAIKRVLAEAHEAHGNVTRALWHAAGGTKRGVTFHKVSMSEAAKQSRRRRALKAAAKKKKGKGKGKRRGDSDAEEGSSSSDEAEDGGDEEEGADFASDEDRDDADGGGTGKGKVTSLSFGGGGVLTIATGARLGVDAESTFVGELCVSSGEVRL